METAERIEIRLLTAGDIDGAMTLSSTAGWNQRAADWRMLLRLAPEGSFAATASGRIIGTAIGIDYERFAWIAMMLVDPAYRGQGLGARLLEAAMEAVPPEIPVRLDATPMGRPLYERYGFRDESQLTRHVADAASRGVRDDGGAAASRVKRLTLADLDHVAEADRAVFGGTRRSVLDWAVEQAAEYAYSIDSDGAAGYCFGRPGRLFDQIGPVVADTADAARALVSAALRAAGSRALVIDAFDSHDGFNRWLSSRGFAGQRPLFRMRRPGSPARPAAAAAGSNSFEYAIFGPEFG